MHEVIVLVQGYVDETSVGKYRAGGTVTLVRGEPNVIIDTGDVWQRHEIVDALAAQGLDPSDIHFVINTHGHADHIGNNNLFPHATFVLDSDLSRHGEYWTHDFVAGRLLIDATDGSAPITVVATPGHTDHDLSVIVTTELGVVAVVGDLFEYEGDEIDNAWQRWSRNAEVQRQSRVEILAMADFIVPGHGDMFRVKAGK